MSVKSTHPKPDKESVRCVCGTWTKGKVLRIEGLRIRGSECPNCGEVFLNGEDARLLWEFRRVKDSILEGRVTRTGNSYALRLPVALVRALGLQPGATVRIVVKGPREMVVSLT